MPTKAWLPLWRRLRRTEAHPIRIGVFPEGRFAPPVESAAYTIVVEAARTAVGGFDVRAEHAGDVLVVEVETHADGLDLVALEDRVGALDGQLVAERGEDRRVKLRAELPCGS